MKDTQEELQEKLSLAVDHVVVLSKLVPCPICNCPPMMEVTFNPEMIYQKRYRIICRHLSKRGLEWIQTAWHESSEFAAREWQLTRKLEQ